MVDGMSYAHLVEQYGKPLYRYCFCRLNGNCQLVEETISDVLKVLLEKWEGLDKQNVRAFMYRTADNCIKKKRCTQKKDNHRFVPLESLQETDLPNKGVYYDRYFENSYLEDEAEYVQEVKERLPEKYRELFDYRFIQKKTIMQISAITGMPYSTVRLRIAKVENLAKSEISKIISKK